MKTYDSIKNKLLFIKNPKFFSSIYYKIIILTIIGYIWYQNNNFIESHNVLSNMMFLGFSYILLNTIFNYSKLAFTYIYLKKNNFQTGHSDNFTIGIEKLSFLLNHIIFILIFIDLIFIDIIQLLTTLSIVAVAMVLIFKEHISNFLNGLNLMFSKDFRLKDTVKMGDFKGEIIDFTFHNVHIKNSNGDIIFIPNSSFMTKEITNLTKSSLKNISIDLTIFKENITLFEEKKEFIVKRILKEFPENIISKESITILYNKLDKDTVNIIFNLNSPKYSYKIEKEIKSFIIKEIGLIISQKALKKRKVISN